MTTAACVLASTDQGTSWAVRGEVEDAKTWLVNPVLEEGSKGQLIMLCRTAAGARRRGAAPPVAGLSPAPRQGDKGPTGRPAGAATREGLGCCCRRCCLKPQAQRVLHSRPPCCCALLVCGGAGEAAEVPVRSSLLVPPQAHAAAHRHLVAAAASPLALPSTLLAACPCRRQDLPEQLDGQGQDVEPPLLHLPAQPQQPAGYCYH